MKNTMKSHRKEKIEFFYKHFWSNYKHYNDQKSKVHSELGFLLAFNTLVIVVFFSIMDSSGRDFDWLYYSVPIVAFAILATFIGSLVIPSYLIPWLEVDKELGKEQSLNQVQYLALVDLFYCIHNQEEYYKKMMWFRWVLVSLTALLLLFMFLSPLVHGHADATGQIVLLGIGTFVTFGFILVYGCIEIKRLNSKRMVPDPTGWKRAEIEVDKLLDSVGDGDGDQ